MIAEVPLPRTVAVAVDRPSMEPLTYEVPAEMAGEIVVGALVEVPLGTRREQGAVVALDPPPPPEGSRFRLKAIIRRISPQYTIAAEIIDLARWMADYYFCSLGEALACVSIVGFVDVAIRERIVHRVAAGWEGLDLTPKQRAAMEALGRANVHEVASVRELTERSGASAAVVAALVKAGAIAKVSEGLPKPAALPPPDSKPAFLPEQQLAFDRIDAVREAGEFGVFLLHGVTGSGKTEVYLRLIERVLDAGESAICLVPEISLTPQTVNRFAARFQTEIGVFHSGLTKQEKLVLAEKIRLGEIRLVIGARSATFAPLPKLGIVIIDEEHEGSYKQGETPRYHARDLAIVRARKLGIPVVLGSATPSVESYENAVRGKFTLLRLSCRPAGLAMPEVRIVPMGNASLVDPTGITMISGELEKAVRDRLARGEQSLLFLNRRGFSNFLMCPSCHWVARCEDDDIALTIHRRSGKARGPIEAALEGGEELELELFPKPLAPDEAYLKCHFCAQASVYPTICPKCEEGEPMAVGTGTQRIEEALQRLFPDARILRLDQDSVGGRKGFLKAWQEMISGEAQIILGTQMIAKGLHLEGVTLVGAILADVGLFIPDFRAEERTFSLLMQVAGRSGRANMGEVLLQTYMPHHSAIQLAAKHDYEAFFAVEMQRRRKLRFPPVERLIALTISDEDFPRAAGAARLLGGILRRITHRHQRSAAILGPQAAPIARLAGRHRQRLLIRGAHYQVNAAVLREALADPQWQPPASLRLAIDVDPQDLL